MDSGNILAVEGLYKKYKDFTLEHVSFSIPSGSIMGLIGENGAGKTTILKLILNLIKSDGGNVTIFGQDSRTDDKAIRERLGVVLDESCFHETLNAQEISKIMRGIYKARWDDVAYHRYLDRFSLSEKKTVKEYSRGMKMKLSIAAAMSHHPDLLILDEATSGLDPVVRSEILDVFFDFIQDETHSVLMSSHITTDLEKVADYITFISGGHIVLSDSKDTLLERYGIVRCPVQAVDRLDRTKIVGTRTNGFGCEVLTVDRRAVKAAHPDLTVDAASLEDIMLFYAKGEKQK